MNIEEFLGGLLITFVVFYLLSLAFKRFGPWRYFATFIATAALTVTLRALGSMDGGPFNIADGLPMILPSVVVFGLFSFMDMKKRATR